MSNINKFKLELYKKPITVPITNVKQYGGKKKYRLSRIHKLRKTHKTRKLRK